MRPFLLLLVGALVTNNLPLQAQQANRFSIRAGYLYTTTAVTWTSNVALYLSPIEPKSGFYAGLNYERRLSTLFTSQIDLNYQQKGYTFRSLPSETLTKLVYNYIGVTPMIGLEPIKNLRFLVGPEINLLLSKPATNSQTLELGVSARSIYQYRRVGLTLGYFKGVTAYYKGPFYYFTNQNWQLGLFYQLNNKRLD